MPMLITLPGPGSAIAPKTAAVDVEIVPGAPAAAKVAQDVEQTSALPSAPLSAEESPVDAGSGAETREAPGAVANIAPEAGPQGEQDSTAAQQETSKAAIPAKAAAEADKKPAAQRSKTAKPAIRRPVRNKSKITPFNGALSGLFSPGAPANKRR
jgi:hypothetical protein